MQVKILRHAQFCHAAFYWIFSVIKKQLHEINARSNKSAVTSLPLTFPDMARTRNFNRAETACHQMTRLQGTYTIVDNWATIELSLPAFTSVFSSLSLSLSQFVTPSWLCSMAMEL